MKHYLSAYAIFFFTFPLRFLPYRAIHALGNALGLLLYHCIPHFRKRALSNLALAKTLKLTNPQIRKLAKESFQNLCITCLEYPKLASEKNIHRLVTCENPELAQSYIDRGQGVIFFCGHQANWELLFIEGTSRMPGVAIGRPIKNPILYKWVKKIRQSQGGTIIEPKNALKEGLRALRQGKFLGIVGDQGMPESSYSYPFFGTRAFTTTAPALLAQRTGAPLITATIVRQKGRYSIHYSNPIDPNQDTHALMDAALKHLEASIAKHPGQWLWQHNRWKQETPHNVYYRFRKDPFLVIVSNPDHLPHLKTFRKIYPRAHMTIIAPQALASQIDLPEVEVLSSKPLRDDYRFKLVYDLANTPNAKSHYTNLAAYEVLSLDDLRALAAHRRPAENLSDILTKAVCRAP
ncbi:MAG: hypothetical protein H7A40_01800 [Chlamydiales bacterium]|nr:hypothetical protein [Chlamydiales bacterium]